MTIRSLVATGIVTGLLLSACAFAWSFLNRQIAGFDEEIVEFEQARERAEHEAARFAALTTQHESIVKQLEVLDGLRGGMAAIRMFEVVDEALDAGIRFKSWDFRRAGEIVDEPTGPVTAGYFIILPQESPNAPKRAWRQETHMEFLAQADTHSALAGFVERLSHRPEVENARIVNTRAESGDAGRIDFELAVVVRSSAAR